MKNFLNAVEAKEKTYEALDRAVEKETEKLNAQIQAALSNGDFSVVWTIPAELETKHIKRILELLRNNNFTVLNDKKLVFWRSSKTFDSAEILEINWEKDVEHEEDLEYKKEMSRYY